MSSSLRNVSGSASVLAGVIVVVTALAVTACGGALRPDAVSVDATTTAPPASASATPTAAPTGTPGPADLGAAAGHALLWPFVDTAAARAWQLSFRGGGGQPWHLDSTETALGFTQGFLGYTGLDRVTSKETQGAEAWVGVGYRAPNGTNATAAVLHLVRLGTEQDAPWEVVGTRDTTLVVDSPGYGSTARFPLTVGGTITGVDESLHVRVLAANGPVGDACCTPAGGTNRRWSVTVPQQGTPSGTLTVAASTGGHVVDVERFAITALRAG